MIHATAQRVSRSRAVVPAVFATALLLFGSAAVASAQSCGDPDGSGAITVTDGVNVRRAAAR